MSTRDQTVPLSPWELAAENIAVKIRWFGLIVGYVIINTSQQSPPDQAVLNAILGLGLVYAVIDTYYSVRGTIFLRRFPLLISAMEALFIGMLCYYHQGLNSPFRYYYLLSLICCAIRHPMTITYATCIIHCGSYTLLYMALPPSNRDVLTLLLTVLILVWVTWASVSMALLLKRVGDHLRSLNTQLKENQNQLEARIEERTHQLQEAQALLLHQEKMAAFGLLAAGIAHEVGNPLTSISSLVQMLQKRNADTYAAEKLGLISGQLKRIQTTLRELINFSRPTTSEKTLVSLHDLIDEALNIAKYHKGTNQRQIITHVAPDIPHIEGKRDLLAQAILNLILNAVEATEKSGRITITAAATVAAIEVCFEDNGCGIAPENQEQLFRAYFTTKRDGTGLGLFVTRKLLAEHDADIRVESVVGVGTSFTITIPRPKVERENEPTKSCVVRALSER